MGLPASLATIGTVINTPDPITVPTIIEIV